MFTVLTKKVFSEISRALKPNGILAISDFTVDEKQPSEVIASLNIRSHGICNFSTINEYMELISSTKLKLIFIEDLSKNLPIHYKKIMDNLDTMPFKTKKDHYKASEIKKGLKIWIDAGNKGGIGWNYFVAQKTL